MGEGGRTCRRYLAGCRPVEEAYADPLLLEDGCVRELEDPELGKVRQPGVMINMEKSAWTLDGPAPSVGQHNAEIRAEAASADASPKTVPAKTAASGHAPLAGLKVLDLGLAIAGPFGTMQLADLGADVIKINTLWDSYWHSSNVAMSANRNKRSLCMDLKNPEALAIFHKLVAEADVVQHNMRYEAAVRLGVDYDSLKKVNPRLVYCHTRGHERGWRETMPGNDQTGACIAGVQYEDGAIANGGKPLWSLTSFGDTGNGWLSAVGIMQALLHRDRTGEGQFVDTSIVNAQLLNISYVLGRPDGSGFDRPRLDGMNMGMTALYSLYQGSEGWFAIAAVNDAHWEALAGVLGISDSRFASAEGRWKADAELRKLLADTFAKDSAANWFAKLDAAGVPVEVADPEGGKKMFKNDELRRRNWIASYKQELVGLFEHAGLGYDFSDTPAEIRTAPLVVGEKTTEILTEMGYGEAEIADLAERQVIGTWAPGQPQIFAFNSKQKVKKKEETAESN
jgi:crotonobetainyl-CoA:carnitine CoA-transferase CaiB-like acyl-CoA transferase